MELDSADRSIINELQGTFPVTEFPFKETARRLGLEEIDLRERIDRLKQAGILSRFGPMYNADAMGGAFCLCAMSVPADKFDTVVGQINAHPEVAHNYARQHLLNVWFVIGSDEEARIEEVIAEIEAETGREVFAFPKMEEFFIGLKVDA